MKNKALLACLLAVTLGGPAVGIARPAEVEGGQTAEAERHKEMMKLDGLLYVCVVTTGQDYVRARDEMLKSPLIGEFLKAKLARDIRGRLEEPVLMYLQAWYRHEKTYREIVNQDVSGRWGLISGRDDPSPRLALALYKVLADRHAPMTLLIESLDKSGEIGYRHSGVCGPLIVLISVCRGRSCLPPLRDEQGREWLEPGREKLPEELALDEAAKRNLVRVANRCFVEGPQGVDDGTEDAWRFRRACLLLIGELGSPESIPVLVQSLLAPNNTFPLGVQHEGFRRALKACTKGEEGKRVFQAVKGQLKAVLEMDAEAPEPAGGAAKPE